MRPGFPWNTGSRYWPQIFARFSVSARVHTWALLLLPTASHPPQPWHHQCQPQRPQDTSLPSPCCPWAESGQLCSCPGASAPHPWHSRHRGDGNDPGSREEQASSSRGTNHSPSGDSITCWVKGQQGFSWIANRTKQFPALLCLESSSWSWLIQNVKSNTDLLYPLLQLLCLYLETYVLHTICSAHQSDVCTQASIFMLVLRNTQIYIKMDSWNYMDINIHIDRTKISMKYLYVKSNFLLSIQFSLSKCSHKCCLEYGRSFSKI